MPAKPHNEDAAKEDAAKDGATPKATGGAQSASKPAADAAAEAPSGRGLKLHHLRPAPGARTAKTRVGRGEASKGKTAGRGTKGTKARNTMRLGFEGGQMPLYRRVPKLKGFSNAGFGTTYQVVNTGRLAELYPSGGDVTPEDLVAKGAIRKGERVKVLADGDISVALRVSAHAFSTSARERITGAGGSVTEL
jgi:large subunit ribosomal protein L15